MWQCALFAPLVLQLYSVNTAFFTSRCNIQLKALSLETSLPWISYVTSASPRLSWESAFHSSCHLLGFFGPLDIVLQLSGDLLMVALGTHHLIFWLQFPVHFPHLVYFLALSRALSFFCCILSVIGNISIPLCTPALCIAVSFHLREISGTASLLPVSCLYQHFISPLQCTVVTVHLNCHRKAEPSRGIHRRDEVCDRKIS